MGDIEKENTTQREQSLRCRRSLSPSGRDGMRHMLRGDRKSTSTERRDYNWHSGGGSGIKQFRSRSPPYEQQIRKREFFDEEVLHRSRGGSPPLELWQRYELSEAMDYNPDAIPYSNLKQVHAYDHHNTSRFSIDKDLDSGGLSASHGHGTSVHKSTPMEENAGRGSVRLHQELGHTSNYKETGGLKSSAAKMGIGRFGDDRLRYRNPLPLKKSSMTESYIEGDKSILYTRDANHSMVPASNFKDFEGSSSVILRGDDSTFYRDAQYLPSDELPRRSGKFIEALAFDEYSHGQRPHLDFTRDPDADPRVLACYRRDAQNPAKAEHLDHLYPTLGDRESDEFGYSSNEIFRNIRGRAQEEYDQIDMHLHPRVDYDHRDIPLHAGLDYDHRGVPLHDRIDHHHKDVLRPSIMESAADSIDNIEGSRLNMRKGSLRNYHSLQEQTTSRYPNMNRISYASKQEREYNGSGSNHPDVGTNVTRDREISHLAPAMDHDMSHLPQDYDFVRDAGMGLQKERLKGPFLSQYDAKRDRPSISLQRMKGEKLGIYDPSVRMLKRKYIMDEETSRHDFRSVASRKLKMPSGIRELNDCGDEWVHEDMDDLYSSKTVGLERAQYRRADRVFDGRGHHRNISYDEWLSTKDSYEHVHGHSGQSFKPDHRYIKVRPRPGFHSWYNSYHINKSDFHKHNKVWKRSTDGHHVDGRVNDDDPSEDWGNFVKSEPPENTEKFKQLVEIAFLKFSKKLNENPAARTRYKEQGRAGSLFCIVCGRSLSKEFMDTQRLVAHTFMSHKPGLRAQHLGLHKAICVLLGWNTVVDPDTVTWSPQPLPNNEAFAQKEDLILWPPVIVIHNSSISDNNLENQRVVTTEDLEGFLRGKGFGTGKIKVCLGKPANSSIMIVKFLGTFSGVENADKLHKYFAENMHGRADFELITSDTDKSRNIGDEEMQGDKLKEHVLYGYMGISEDLDKLDFDTKRRSLIRSKKEIQDLADDPVKPNER